MKRPITQKTFDMLLPPFGDLLHMSILYYREGLCALEYNGFIKRFQTLIQQTKSFLAILSSRLTQQSNDNAAKISYNPPK
jgi:hypothetical protein